VGLVYDTEQSFSDDAVRKRRRREEFRLFVDCAADFSWRVNGDGKGNDNGERGDEKQA
jgi:hypothetical protein